MRWIPLSAMLALALSGCASSMAFTLEDVRQAKVMAMAAGHEEGVACYGALEAPLAAGAPKGILSAAEAAHVFTVALQGPCRPLASVIVGPLLTGGGGAGFGPGMAAGLGGLLGGALPALLPMLMAL